jgi:hypothetical protein
VIPRYDSRDSRTEGLVRDIRDRILANQTAFKSDTVYVGGEAATFYDYKIALYQRFPYALVAVMVMIFLILMMFFQSLFLPVKAIVLNLLSVAATFGVVVLVFQHGFASQLLRFDALGYITVTTPVMLYVILFSLSTDYEVFLLSRVKEYYYSHGDNREAVAVGLQHTAGLITAAALILLGTFGSFSFGDSLVVKELGVGLGVGVLIDSTLVRVVLVPATMALAGRANWWLPSSIKRFLPALGEGTSIALAGQAEAAPAPAMAAVASTAPETNGHGAGAPPPAIQGAAGDRSDQARSRAALPLRSRRWQRDPDSGADDLPSPRPDRSPGRDLAPSGPGKHQRDLGGWPPGAAGGRGRRSPQRRLDHARWARRLDRDLRLDLTRPGSGQGARRHRRGELDDQGQSDLGAGPR